MKTFSAPKRSGLWLNTVLFVFYSLTINLAVADSQPKIGEVENGVVVKSDEMNVKVQFFADSVVRVVKWLPEGTDAKESLIVLPRDLAKVDVVVDQADQRLTLESSALKVVLDLQQHTLSYFDKAGRLLLSEAGQSIYPVKGIAGEAHAFSLQQDFVPGENEGIYGMGQHQDGFMNYRGHSILISQSNTEAMASFLISNKPWGVLWDNTSLSKLDATGDVNRLWSEVGDNIDYYFVGGSDMDAVIAGYRDLTGDAPMYGKWSYGYWQCKEHYHTQDELLNVAKKYRELEIPIDSMIQDWNYWGDMSMWSGMVFDPERYPDPKGMVDWLHDNNFHIIISIWTGLGPNTEIYKAMDEKGFLYDKVGWAGFKYYDAFNSEANDIYWDYLQKELVASGMDGWWIDSTEPDVVNALTKESQSYEMHNIEPNHLGSWPRYLNAYSLKMTDDLYKNIRKKYDDKRVYILTRSTFSGQQRNGATTWSGDIGASWEQYKNQITAGLNHCMSGIPYWTFDIGAFVLGSYEGLFSYGGKDPAYQELYTRMFQLGAFSPIFRSHGSETPREIWEFGDFEDTLIKFDHLRYRLLPTIYSMAWKVTSEGYTMMRGLPMDFPEDTKILNIDDQFMFGSNMMVCPVVEYQLHRPPESSVLIEPNYYQLEDGSQGAEMTVYDNVDFTNPIHEEVVPEINLDWYTQWPDYMKDPEFGIRWKTWLVPDETGKHRIHIKSFGPKRVFLDGKQLDFDYVATEAYTVPVELEAGKRYELVYEIENRTYGALRGKLFWKTPSIHAAEKVKEERKTTRSVYFPEGTGWTDFWTGEHLNGGQKLEVPAPIEICPLYVRDGSIVAMGPDLQYATEKPADPIELRVYAGADADFVLYEDENEGYDYEKGIFATIPMHWDDVSKTLTIGERKGSFPGMLESREFRIVLVGLDHGVDVGISVEPDGVVHYHGAEVKVTLK